MKFIYSMFLAFMLTSCSSMNSYVEPNNTASQPLSTIHGEDQSNGLFTWRESRITSIDDKDISYRAEDFIGTSISRRIIQVTPGHHNFVILTRFNRSYSGSGPFQAITELQATLKPGINYRINSDVKGAHVAVWISKENGEKVSAVASSVYTTYSIRHY